MLKPVERILPTVFHQGHLFRPCILPSANPQIQLTLCVDCSVFDLWSKDIENDDDAKQMLDEVFPSMLHFWRAVIRQGGHHTVLAFHVGNRQYRGREITWSARL
ncbi:MAG: hypothetical protein KF760_17865 [Candidatus Eremiobacteraeota bacterium]|nr:hypothetical protein [Candidatus Eremiobacteraeota bacterium]